MLCSPRAPRLELPAVLSALPALGVTPALGPPRPPAPNFTHPGHEVPNQVNSSHRRGWLHPSLRDATRSSARGSPATPHPGGQAGALLESRCPGKEFQPPQCRLPLFPSRSPAAAFQGCKTYWKSCRCKSWPPGRARNLSCNPKRAAGSKHAGCPARHHPASEILFKISSGQEDTEPQDSHSRVSGGKSNRAQESSQNLHWF